jgi:hypothetical protein
MYIVPLIHCAHADVEVREHNHDEAGPRPQHVASIKRATTFVHVMAEWRFGQAIAAATDDVPE